MAREDPASLATVEDFTVGRRGMGFVTWRGPTDVRGLDLDAIVRFGPKEVNVYMDDSKKPPLGEVFYFSLIKVI